MSISIFALIIGAIFVNNVVLSQFLGICPFLGVSKDVKSSVGMGGAVLFVMLLATLVTWILNEYILVRFGIEYLQTIVYILVIAGLVQMVEIVLKKIAPALYQALGVFLPLITTNCAVLGVALIVVAKHMNLAQSMIYSASIAVGFTLALVIFAGIREQLELTGVPKGMKGVPIALVSAGILAMAFMGFNGLVPLP
ncbi:MAG: electron transport complex protein RnfA [Bacteroidales bacterium]|jgi:electron transport complex protein RnfA|nr:electron transport complex protein RnfA [Bacteroidales bacterium]MBQ6741774.1 electron transport complex protein RnfA [Bacteroidales bacterium]